MPVIVEKSATADAKSAPAKREEPAIGVAPPGFFDVQGLWAAVVDRDEITWLPAEQASSRAAAGRMVNRDGPCPARLPPPAITGPDTRAGAGIARPCYAASHMAASQPVPLSNSAAWVFFPSLLIARCSCCCTSARAARAGVASGKGLRGEPKRNAVFAPFARNRALSFRRKPLGAREGEVLSDTGGGSRLMCVRRMAGIMRERDRYPKGRDAVAARGASLSPVRGAPRRRGHVRSCNDMANRALARHAVR